LHNRNACKGLGCRIDREQRLATGGDPLLDIGGLVSPEVIPIIRDGDALWALFEARQARWLMAYFYQTPGATGTDARLCPVFMSENAAAGAAGGNPLIVYRLNLNSVNERNEDEPCLINPSR